MATRASKRPREICDALQPELAEDAVRVQCRKAQQALVVAALSQLPEDVVRSGRLDVMLATPLPHPTEGTMSLARRLERQAQLFMFPSDAALESSQVVPSALTLPEPYWPSALRRS